MPYKNKADANAASRRRYVTDPEVKRKFKVALKKWEHEHRDERNEYRAAWDKADRNGNLEERRAYEFAREMKNYGATVEWYRDKLIEQNGLCTLCGHLSHHHGTIQRLQVDHSHDCCDLKTKSCGQCVRGLLCADCNMELGYFEGFYSEILTIKPVENSWVQKALNYISHYRSLRFGPAVAAVEADFAKLGADLDAGLIPDAVSTYPGRLCTPGRPNDRPMPPRYWNDLFRKSLKNFERATMNVKTSRFDQETKRCST